MKPGALVKALRHILGVQSPSEQLAPMAHALLSGTAEGARRESGTLDEAAQALEESGALDYARRIRDDFFPDDIADDLPVEDEP